MVEILVGPIASGKSTWSRKRAAQGAIIVSDDAIVLGCHGGDYSQYDVELKPMYKCIENMMLSMAVAFGRDVVIDRPNLNLGSRERFIALARSHDVPVVAVEFPIVTSEEHARRRVLKDSRGMTYESWLKACQFQMSQYSKPTVAEGLDNVIPVSVAEQMLADGSWVRQ